MHPDFSTTLMVYVYVRYRFNPFNAAKLRHETKDFTMNRVACRSVLIDTPIGLNYDYDDACMNHQCLRCANYNIIIKKLIII